MRRLSVSDQNVKTLLHAITSQIRIGAAYKNYGFLSEYAALTYLIFKKILAELFEWQPVEVPESCLIIYSWFHFNYPIELVQNIHFMQNS